MAAVVPFLVIHHVVRCCAISQYYSSCGESSIGLCLFCVDDPPRHRLYAECACSLFYWHTKCTNKRPYGRTFYTNTFAPMMVASARVSCAHQLCYAQLCVTHIATQPFDYFHFAERMHRVQQRLPASSRWRCAVLWSMALRIVGGCVIYTRYANMCVCVFVRFANQLSVCCQQKYEHRTPNHRSNITSASQPTIK